MNIQTQPTESANIDIVISPGERRRRPSSSSSRRRHRRSSVASSSAMSSSRTGLVQDPTLPWEYLYTKPDEELSPWLKCAICLNVFVDPHVSLTCQHTFCKGCILQAFTANAERIESDPDRERNAAIEAFVEDVRAANAHGPVGTGGASSSRRSSRTRPNLSREGSAAPETRRVDGLKRRMSAAPCPNCRTPLHLADVKPATSLVRQMVDSLEVFCTNKPRGCGYKCERHLLLRHLQKDCIYAFVGEYGGEPLEGTAAEGAAESAGSGCPACGAQVQRKDWEAHIDPVDGSCSTRWLKCKFCGVQSRDAGILSSHQDEDCPSAPLRCEHCGQEGILREKMPEHLSKVCWEALVKCSRARFGCTWIGKRKHCPDGTYHDDEDGDGHAPQQSEAGGIHECTLSMLDPFLRVYAHDMTSLREENDVLRNQLERAELGLRSANVALDRCMRALGPFLPEYPSPEPLSGASEGNYPGASSLNVTDHDASEPARGFSPTPSSSVHQAPGEPGPSSSRPAPIRARGSSESRRAAHENLSQTPVTSPGAFAPGHHLSRSLPTFAAGLDGASMHIDRADYLQGQALASPVHEVRSLRDSRSPHVPPAGDGESGLDLTTELASLKSNLDDLSVRLRLSESRADEGHMAAISASFDAGRTREEMQSLRHVVGAIRMQMHQMLMQMQRPYPLSGFNMPSGTPGAGDVPGSAGPGPSPSGGQAQPSPSAASTAGANVLGMGMGGPIPFVRRWTAFEGTKL